MEGAFKFGMGKVFSTNGAREKFSAQEINSCLLRHKDGDWGDIDEQDAKTNNQSVAIGGMVLSRYAFGKRTLYIITDPGHKITTVLLP